MQVLIGNCLTVYMYISIRFSCLFIPWLKEVLNRTRIVVFAFVSYTIFSVSYKQSYFVHQRLRNVWTVSIACTASANVRMHTEYSRWTTAWGAAYKQRHSCRLSQWQGGSFHVVMGHGFSCCQATDSSGDAGVWLQTPASDELLVIFRYFSFVRCPCNSLLWQCHLNLCMYNIIIIIIKYRDMPHVTVSLYVNDLPLLAAAHVDGYPVMLSRQSYDIGMYWKRMHLCRFIHFTKANSYTYLFTLHYITLH